MKNCVRMAKASLLLLVLGGLVFTNGAAAGENDDLDFVVFHVGALTSGTGWHVSAVPPPVTMAEMAGSGGYPLFGVVGEEPTYPVGQIDELIELTKSLVEPHTWETVDGADMRANGEATLVVRAPRKTIRSVGEFLADLERRLLPSIQIDFRAVPDENAGLPELALSLHAVGQQRAAGFSGMQKAYVGDYLTRVAQGASISTPLVEVANLGVIADAEAAVVKDGSMATLAARVCVVRLEALPTSDVGQGRRVHNPTFRYASVQVTRTMPTERWTRIGSGSGWTVMARVRARSHVGTPATPPSLRMSRGTTTEHAARMFDISDLTMRRGSRWAQHAHLTPSGYTPPEPPELPEPVACMSGSAIVELLREAGGEAAWQDPMSIEARNGRLIARNEPTLLREISRVLDVVRTELDHMFELEIEVLQVPRPVGESLRALDRGVGVPATAVESLARARESGAVRRIRRAYVSVTGRAGGAANVGSVRRYIGDYHPDIAQESASTRPGMFEVHQGLHVMATVNLLSTGDAAHIQLQECQDSHHGAQFDRFDTTAGPVELPELHAHRMRGGFIAPLDRPVVVSLARDGERTRVMLATLRRVNRR